MSDPIITPPLKRCSKCGTEYPATTEFFYKKGGGSLRPDCKACFAKGRKAWCAANSVSEAERKKAWRAAHKDQAAETHKAWNAANKERKSEASKAWYKANRAYRAEYRKSWYESNKERTAETRKAWAMANPEKVKVSDHLRRARRRSLPINFTADDLRAALAYFGDCCAVCGRPRGLWHTLAADHWIPISKGGPTTPANIVPLCHGVDGCNNRKQDTMPEVWLEREFGKRKAMVIAKRIADFFAWVTLQSTL